MTVTSPRRGLSEQATDAAIDQACRMLRLLTIRARAGEVTTAAKPATSFETGTVSYRLAHARTQRATR